MVNGVLTLDGDEIGTFQIFASGLVEIVLNKIDNNLADVLEYASDNGMTIALEMRPSFDDHVPRHAQDIPSPR